MQEHWAILAARRVHLRFLLQAHAPQDTSIAALAHIILTAAEPLVTLLRESKREHSDGEDMMCETDPTCGDGGECTCGADDWNRRVDAVLNE